MSDMRPLKSRQIKGDRTGPFDTLYGPVPFSFLKQCGLSTLVISAVSCYANLAFITNFTERQAT